MKIKAALIAVAMLFGFASFGGGVGVSSPAEAQRYDRGPGYGRDYRRPPPRFRNRGYRSRRYYSGRRYYNRGGYYRGGRSYYRRDWRQGRRRYYRR